MNRPNHKNEMPSTLKNIFHPENVAVIGASTTFGKWGQVIFSNIKAGGFKGRISPVNPKGGKMFGLDVFPSIIDISDRVDLAFIESFGRVFFSETAVGVLAGMVSYGRFLSETSAH